MRLEKWDEVHQDEFEDLLEVRRGLLGERPRGAFSYGHASIVTVLTRIWPGPRSNSIF